MGLCWEEYNDGPQSYDKFAFVVRLKGTHAQPLVHPTYNVDPFIRRLQHSPYFYMFQWRAVKRKVWKETRTESETGERRYGRVRLASFTRVRLLRHVLSISLLILRKKPIVLQSSVFAIAPTIQHCLGWRRANSKGHLLKDGTALRRHYCPKDFCSWM